MKWADLTIINALEQVRDAYTNSTPATGNATQGDVALGKTFSSAILNGATGTSTKNATVPNDAPIQPAQAYVNWTIAFFVTGFPSFDSTPSYAGFGMTEFNADSNIFYDRSLGAGYLETARRLNNLGDPIDFSGNALSEQSVNLILLVANAFSADKAVDVATLDISGGTNAAPTGQGLTDKAALIDLGWTVTTN